MEYSIFLPAQEPVPIKSMKTSEVKKIIADIENLSLDEWCSDGKKELIHILKKELISRN